MPRLRTLEEVIRLTERARIRYVTNASIDPPGLSTQLFLGCINARIQHRRLEVDLASYMPDRAQPQTFNGVDWDVGSTCNPTWWQAMKRDLLPILLDLIDALVFLATLLGWM
jgi:hypothetical protein